MQYWVLSQTSHHDSALEKINKAIAKYVGDGWEPMNVSVSLDGVAQTFAVLMRKPGADAATR